jgi:hypothetical protein
MRRTRAASRPKTSVQTDAKAVRRLLGMVRGAVDRGHCEIAQVFLIQLTGEIAVTSARVKTGRGGAAILEGAEVVARTASERVAGCVAAKSSDPG